MCKAVKKLFDGKFAPTSNVLEAIHLDLVGPFQTRSVGGAQYFLTIVDQHSGLKVVKLLKHKSQTLEKFEEFVPWAENQTGKTIKRIISDNGGEFKNIFFEDFCRSRGINHQFAPAYTPENNGVSERSNRAILDKARCLFAQANLSPRFWAEAVVTATDLCNLLPSRTRNFSIPYDTFFGRSVDISKLRPFGCLAYLLIPEAVRTKKLDARSEKCIFVGYANNFSTYRFVKIESKSLCTSRNVTFDETIFPSLSNESLDESSFFFNPFETINDINEEEVDNFEPFPNQERVRPINDIIGDISSDNIISHPRREVAESFNTESPEDDTLSYNQAMSLPNKAKWEEALNKETENMKSYEVWDVIKRTAVESYTAEDKPINCTWVFKIKPESSNQLEEHKARLCVQGFKEVFGKDYNATFAPTGKLVSLRLLVIFSLQHNFEFHQIDVKCAFLNAPIRERITLNAPPGINSGKLRYRILLLKKALYGLKQAPKEWHLTLSSWLLSVGFNRSYTEPCVFWSANTWLYVHVDDIAIFSPEPEIFKNLIKKRFKIKDLGSAKHLLGMKVVQSSEGVHFTQTHYIEETLLKYKCQDLIPLATPMKPGVHLVKASRVEREELEKSNYHYRGLVGALNYLSVTTRPDITFTVGCLSQFLQSPGILHWNAAVHCLRYLKGSKDFGISVRKSPVDQFDFVSYVDASWASCQITSKSTTGYLILWNNNLISWRSKKQLTTFLSSTEAEYIAITEITKELLWLKMVIDSALKIPIPLPFKIFEDNQGAIMLANNEANHSGFKTKHMNTRFHFVRAEIIAKTICLAFKRTHLMLADFLTKSVGRSSIFKALKVLRAASLPFLNSNSSLPPFLLHLDATPQLYSSLWFTRRAQIPHLSSTESEYRAYLSAAQESKWIRKMLEDTYKVQTYGILFSDNQGAIKLASNPVFHSRTKHIDVHYNYIREAVKYKEIVLEHIPTADMTADIMTKALDRVKHIKFSNSLSLSPPTGLRGVLKV
ncbi:hypothetical protein MJO28_002728 [Puccinia striiformis f. sp. tritici]|uniref:Uncharacterized protein n=1 Tax=Puccinia striiformis f. sp. tritici TaxID=168172 RepID=A0ACC0ER65_9BASI|nr:hypothetical protein MJO28_002728 [Puccinia striiformis f. sp. tritici]